MQCLISCAVMILYVFMLYMHQAGVDSTIEGYTEHCMLA